MKKKDIQSIMSSLEKLKIIAKELGRYDEIKASIKAKKEVKT